VIDGFCPPADVAVSEENHSVESLGAAREFFEEIASRDGKKDRSGLLAQLELEKRARAHAISDGTHAIYL
jgi:N-terminal acetyltransferase B complex non-catalytic subunit